MLKAKARTADGPVYVFGLSDCNVELLRRGDPIFFDGREVQAPTGHWFLIAYAETPGEVRRYHDRFAPPGQHTHTIGISQKVLAGLKLEPVRMPGARMSLDADVLLFAGDTEAALAAALGFAISEPKSGFRDELDPLTGTVRRVPVERPT